MKNTLLFFGLLITLTLGAQTPYQKGMNKAFELWEQQENTKAAQLFERISQAEPDKWLPPFYATQIYMVEAFNTEDKSKMAETIKKAETFLNVAQERSANNPELMVLEAQLLTAWILYDSDQYGMKNSMKITEIYKKAAELAPDNPRVVLGNAEWNIGSAKFFNKDVSPYCAEVERAIELFATFKPEGAYYPSKGRERALRVLELNCGN